MGIHYNSINSFSVYKKLKIFDDPSGCPIALDWGSRTVSLSLSASVSDSDAERVVDVVKTSLNSQTIMIKILTPISHLFSENPENARMISASSDYLEARERTAQLRLSNTSHYHIDFDLNLGITEEQKTFLHLHVKDRSNITHLTFQAARDCHDADLINGMYMPKSPPLSLSEQVNITKKSIREIRDIVGSDRKIGIENNNYYPTGAYDVSTSLEYLLEVLSIKDLHLLLDIAHAKVSAFNLKVELNEYIMPLLETDLCKQVHISNQP